MKMPRLLTAGADSPPTAIAAGLLRLAPYLAAALAILATLLYTPKFWAVNDDIGMAMIAHGYGIADQPSPDLVYSNIVWGWLTFGLGTPFGIQGYAFAQFALVLLSCAVVALTLYRARVPGFVAAALLLIMFVPTLTGMQFSVTAGYLAVAGLALALDSTRSRTLWPWCAAAAFILMAALIRFNECAFILLIASPFYAAHLLRGADRQTRLRWAGMLAAVGVLWGGCAVLDRVHYSGAEWSEFKRMNPLRRQFTDYGLAEHFNWNPDELAGTGLSPVDMQMMHYWFFDDADVFSAAKLEALEGKMSLPERIGFNLNRYRKMAAPFQDRVILSLLALFAFAAFAGRRRQVALGACLLMFGVMAVFWLLGRPGETHVYYASCAALAALGMIGTDYRVGRLVTAAGIALFGLALAIVWLDRQDNLHDEQRARIAVRTACHLPSDRLLLAWGGPEVFNDFYLYRPTAAPGGACPLQLYLFDVLELTPESMQKLHAYTQGKDFMQALLEGQSFDMLTDARHIDLLSTYLHEHYHATLSAQRLPGAIRAFQLQAAPEAHVGTQSPPKQGSRTP